MQVTKNLAELCALLVDDIYGELPSRIFAALLNKGRSSVHQLTQYTSLTPRQLRHGLVVLLQNNLLYYHVDSGNTIYTASPSGAYSLVRIGKILDMVGSIYGDEEKEVMQNVLHMGHTKIGDLREAYQAKFRPHPNGARQDPPTVNGDAHDDDAEAAKRKADPRTGLFVNSLEQLDAVLCKMLGAELLTVVTSHSFRSPEDAMKEIEDEIKTTHFPGGVRGAKGKEEYIKRLSRELREVREAPLSLKRKLQNDLGMNKRRRLANGYGENGAHDSNGGLVLDAETVLRINHDKCAVELRNQQLTHVVSELLGETTSQIYATLLRLLSKKLHRCRSDPLLDGGDDEDVFSGPVRLSTNEVFESLDPSLDVFTGLGKVSAQSTDRKSANRIYEYPPDQMKARVPADEAEVVGVASSDEEESDNDRGKGKGKGKGGQDEDDDHGNDGHNGQNGTAASGSGGGMNGTKEHKVTFDDKGPAKLSRKEQFRQHLLLLCEGKHKFLRHCAMEAWTVDFESLFRSLREMELDTVIERSAGQTGLRLVRILRKVGKMDEKTLPMTALMTKGEVQKLMLQMQMLGYIDMQEIPRDNNRTVSRTMFLYWTDTPRCLDRLLDNTYKTMLRCFQVLEVHRQREREVLGIVKRDDVRGREKEMMQERYYNKFVKVTETQEKLLAHVMRLDSLVGVLRDF